ncbi:MAG TPA: multicopper oxidase domain-containing protein, partial [Alcanivoracaceae bacterium]|nr:multicopper oxidase domain-containing protein [Alcanivoracaceae bacterium]
ETVVFHVKQQLPGIRMFHCHILEHEDLGMMANLEVI